jgi:23S rRNA (uracil1939-C5)-methyltransferase
METVTVQLTTMAHGGAALGRIDRQAVFVPYALPGERVRVEITDDRGRFAFARVLEVLEPSVDRVEPLCPHFGPSGCGGCQWQHIEYEAQLRLKADVLIDQLGRIGGVESARVLPALADRSGWAYRNRARFHRSSETGLGFLAAGSEQVIGIDECAILEPRLQDLYSALDLDLPGLRNLTLRAGVAAGDQLLLFEMEDDSPPALEVDLPVSCALLRSDGQIVSLIGSDHITESVGGHHYRVSGPAFFQANTAQTERLVRVVLEQLDLRRHEVVLDAYCGVGLFTAPMAEQAALVVAIEVNPYAVDDLIENTSGYDNVEMIEGPVEAVLPDLSEAFGAAVVDPPRTGLDRSALDALVVLRPRRIAYVSCDAATLARDAKRLIRAGYELQQVQPIDMFPQTFHIECVALFVA